MLGKSTLAEQELQAASAKCLEALNAREFRELDALPGVPRDASGWFELLSQYDQQPGAAAALRKTRAALPAGLAAAGVKIEHYAVLNALVIAAPRFVSASVPDTIKCLYATMCMEIAEREPPWESHFDMEGDPERFLDVAQLATLRRFPAGALNFAYERLALLHVTLNIHPLSLPGYLYQRVFAMPFTKPAIAPHWNYGRKGSLIVQRTDYERSLWLIAKTLEMNPETCGICGWSWFYSRIVGEVFPHLAWMRDAFADGGAYFVDTYPAHPGGYGFAYNSRKRQILYDQGKFCPRQTAFFWERGGFLDWASRHPELVPEGEAPVQAPRRRASIRVRSPKPARHAKHNSPVTLWNGAAALNRIGRLNYVVLVFVLPALVLSSAVFLAFGLWPALLTLPVWVWLAFAFQYFFSI